MIALYIFRHGQTDWNLQRRFQGSTDIPLNDTGREQARQLGQRLAALPIEQVLTSDLSRARETAEIAFKGTALPLEICPDLREAYLGEPEGMTRDEVHAKFGVDGFQKWMSMRPEDLDFSFPGGENKRHHLARVQNFLRGYFKLNSHLRCVAISTHAGVVNRLISACEAGPGQLAQIPNGSIYRIDFFPETDRWIYSGIFAAPAAP